MPCPDMLARADELDRHAGHAVDRQSGTAARVAIELRQDHARQPDAFVEPARAAYGVLPRHRVRHQQHFPWTQGRLQGSQLVHEFGVDLQPPSGVHNDRAAALRLGVAQRAARQVHDGGVSRFPFPGEYRDADLLAQLLELLPRRWPVRIRRHEARRLVLELQAPRELRRSRRLPRALEPDQQDHRRPHRGELQGRRPVWSCEPAFGPDGRAEHPRNLVVDELHDLLTGAHRLHLNRPDGPLPHPLDEALRHLEADVRLEQVAPDLPERVGHVPVREHATSREPLEDGGNLVGEGRKHKPTKLVSELPESKWVCYLGRG